MSKLVKYSTYWKEKISLISKWKLMINEREILNLRIQIVENQIQLLEEASEDWETVEYWNKEGEQYSYIKRLKENVLDQKQIGDCQPHIPITNIKPKSNMPHII